MHRPIAILLILCYLLGTTGLDVSFHYCGSQFKYASFVHTEEKDSCCKGEMKESGCCNNETVKLKVDDHKQHNAASFQFLKFTGIPVPQPLFILAATGISYIADVYQVTHSPPLLSRQLRLYLHNCIFLI